MEAARQVGGETVLSKERINARFGTQTEFKRLRAAIMVDPNDYLCFCFDGDHLAWCDALDGHRGCIHRHNEVTDLFNLWLDGDINRAQLVKALVDRGQGGFPTYPWLIEPEKILVTREE